ncbi:MAG: hypothetical protein R3194_09800 [Limnobacter sp.]|nr:hypothetical protein [Limnobacter sp.]
MNLEHQDEVAVFERLKNQALEHPATQATFSQIQACPPNEEVLRCYQGLLA